MEETKATWEHVRWELVGSFKLEEPAQTNGMRTFRTKVPGGWLVAVRGLFIPSPEEPLLIHIGYWGGVTFYPDPSHEWDGTSIEQ